jgi:hypothetical protein
MEKNTDTGFPVAAATDAIIAAICSFSRVPETQTILIFWDMDFLYALRLAPLARRAL